MTFTRPAPDIDTHRSRILHHDRLDAPLHDDAARTTPKEIAVTMKATADHDPEPARSPFGSAMILLGIYMAMYLAVAEIVHVLAPAEASTVASRADRGAMSNTPTQPAASGAAGDSHATTD